MKGIIGIGNAITDIMTVLPDETLLKQINFSKGSMQLVDEQTIKNIESLTNQFSKTLKSGGSVANTIYGIASFNFPTAYIGKIGHDKIGKFYQSDMEQQGVKCYFSMSELASGKAIVMVTPDSERTFATYLGAASELKLEDIEHSWLDDYAIIYIEGYLIFNKELVLKVAEMAKEKGLLISYDLASYNIVADNRDFIRSFLRNYVDIVFANEEEAKALTSKSPEESLNELAEYCSYAVVKIGKNGSLIKHNGQTYKIPAIKANVIDTTGAGDWYASGFLYGLCNQLPIETSGKIATLLAGNVIEHIGAKIPQEKLKHVIEMAKKL
ncbi:MAG: adenosine kinase [Bacteroidales bacterium]